MFVTSGTPLPTSASVLRTHGDSAKMLEKPGWMTGERAVQERESHQLTSSREAVVSACELIRSSH